MAASQHQAQIQLLTADAASGTVEPDGFDDANPWREALDWLTREARRRWRLILAVALTCAALAGMARAILPVGVKATAQILIDPQESRALGLEAAPASLEANAAINYVESQMGVIGSERVLLRVVREQGFVGGAADVETPELKNPAAGHARETAENRALLKLQKAVTIQRAERSFLVNVTVADKNPEVAAQLANAVVKAYADVNTTDQNAAGRRLAAGLDARLAETRSQLAAAETRLQDYKLDHNLLGVHDRSIVERQIGEATDALGLAESREAQASAKVRQLDGAGGDISGVPAFGQDPQSR